jgi:ATP-dependent Clp protease ATP-binding subunit ClpB
MTSNLGSQLIEDMGGEERYAEMRNEILAAVSREFRPEFLNRIDEIVVFHALDTVAVRAIADIQLARLKQRLAEQDMILVVSPVAADRIGEIGFDPVYGARPLKRAIQTHLETPLAKALLAGHFSPGDTINVDLDRDELAFSKATASAA